MVSLIKNTRERIFDLTIFLIPFFYTTAIILPFASIKPFQLSGALLVFIYLFDQLRRLVSSPKEYAFTKTDLLAIGFLAILGLSLFMPSIFSNSVKVIPEGSMEYDSIYFAIPLKFSSGHITQLLYPSFGVFLFMSISSAIHSHERLKKVVDILLIVLVLLFIFIVFFHFCNLTGRQDLLGSVFAFFIADSERGLFVNDIHAIGSIIRSFTFVGEPGYTALFYIMMLGLIIGTRYGGYKNGYHKMKIQYLIPIILISILLLASTTGYLGVFTWIIAFLVTLKLRVGSEINYFTDKQILVIAGVVFATFGVVFMIIVNIVGIDLIAFFIEHISKIGGEYGSGASRLSAIKYTFNEVFMKAPILGVGYGSHKTSALFFTLLANVGIVGLTMFLWLNIFIFRRAWKAMVFTRTPDLAQITFAIITSYLSMMPLLLFVKSLVSILFGWYWLLLAMLEACYRLYKKEGISHSS